MGQSQDFVPIAFLFVSIFGILFLYSLHGFLKIRRLKKSGHMVYGKVVDISTTDYPDGPVYSAIIEFITLDGQTICFKSNERGSSIPTVGESVVVLYESRKPDEAVEFNISSERQSTVAVIFFGSVVFLLLIAILSRIASVI